LRQNHIYFRCSKFKLVLRFVDFLKSEMWFGLNIIFHKIKHLTPF